MQNMLMTSKSAEIYNQKLVSMYVFGLSQIHVYLPNSCVLLGKYMLVPMSFSVH